MSPRQDTGQKGSADEWASSWDKVTRILHEAGYRTLAMDQRGYSPRARPRRRRDYKVDQLVGDVLALIDSVPGGTAHLVGHDWGAAVAWSVAMSAPEQVRTLTAVSVAHPAAFFSSFVRSGQAVRSWYMGLFQLPFLPERLASSDWFEALLRKGGMTEDDAALGRLAPEHTGPWVDAPYRFVVLPGVSHWIPTQAPDELADAILDRVRSHSG